MIEITVGICESFKTIGIDISEVDLRRFETALYERGLNVAPRRAPPPEPTEGIEACSQIVREEWHRIVKELGIPPSSSTAEVVTARILARFSDLRSMPLQERTK